MVPEVSTQLSCSTSIFWPFDTEQIPKIEPGSVG